MTNTQACRQLDELGYVLLPDVMDADLRDRLCKRVEELFAAEGDDAGAEFKTEAGARRLANLVNKGSVFREIAIHPAVHAFYCRRDKPQQQYQKQLLDVGLQATLPARLRELLALDDGLNDDLARQSFARSGFLK